VFEKGSGHLAGVGLDSSQSTIVVTDTESLTPFVFDNPVSLTDFAADS